MLGLLLGNGSLLLQSFPSVPLAFLTAHALLFLPSLDDSLPFSAGSLSSASSLHIRPLLPLCTFVFGPRIPMTSIAPCLPPMSKSLSHSEFSPEFQHLSHDLMGISTWGAHTYLKLSIFQAELITFPQRLPFPVSGLSHPFARTQQNSSVLPFSIPFPLPPYLINFQVLSTSLAWSLRPYVEAPPPM